MKITTHHYLLLGAMMLGNACIGSASTSFDIDLTTQSQAAGLNTLTMTSGSLSISETAYWANVTNNNTGTESGTGNKLAQTWIGAYAGNGLGVCNPGEQSNCTNNNQHQVDNYHGLDFIQFDFHTAVNLTDISVANFGNPTGSGSSDVDISYAFLSATQEAALLQGNLVFSSITFTTTNTSHLSSKDYSGLSGTGQYLLIGADVNPYYGDGNSSSEIADAFKIQGLSGTTVSSQLPTTAPEPASFVLIGSGLLAGAFFRRRRIVAGRNN